MYGPSIFHQRLQTYERNSVRIALGIQGAGVDSSDCFERGDLEDKYATLSAEHKAAGATSSANANSSADNQEVKL